MTWRFVDESGHVASRTINGVMESRTASAIDEEILPYEPNIPGLILRAVAEIRTQRQPIIEILDGLQASALTKGEAIRAQVIETAKQGLRDLTNIDLTTCVSYDEMRLKVKTAYFQLAAALPADLRLAFKEATN
jgi:hypothetical protein